MIDREKTCRTVAFVSLGCAKNTVDSERMLAQIAQAGFAIVGQAEDREFCRADIVVVNTCGFIAPAIRESLSVIRRIVRQKVSARIKKVVVVGCLSQRFGARLFDLAKGIDAVVGLAERDNIAQILAEVLSVGGPRCYLGGARPTTSDDTDRLRINPVHWAYLRISEGCNRRCSFCTIPSIRGRFHSKPVDMILTEARELARSGAVELNVIGQDTTYYGRDLKEANALPRLLRRLEQVESLKWIRLLYAHPAGIDEALIETIATSRKVLHYLDIPLQHISDRILQSMRRGCTHRQIIRLIERLRGEIPDVVLRTTLIVGYPGESDSEFEELLDFVKWARFDALGAFPFYGEPGTKAAELSDQITDKIKRQRLNRLMLTQQKIAFARNRSRIGSRLVCLVDQIHPDGGGVARFYGQAPEVDSICAIRKCAAQAGQFIDANVTGTQDYDLVVEQVRTGGQARHK